MFRTVKCKLLTSPEDEVALRATLTAFANACNEILAESKRLNLRHRYAIQSALYKPVRLKHGLTAMYGVRACDRVAADFSAKRVVTSYRPTSATTDKQLCRYIPKGESISVATVHGRKHIALSLGEFQRGLLVYLTPGMGNVSVDRRGRFFVNFRVCVPDPPPVASTSVIGVDMGINRIATVSTGKMFSGRKLNRIRERFSRTRASLQAKGTKGCKRALKRLSGREQRFQRDTNHCISKAIVKIAGEQRASIAIEELKGIRTRTAKVNRAHRSRMGRWAFFQLKQFIRYKADGAGIEVVAVNPAYTSKRCAYCGEIGIRSKHKFSCVSCGLVGDADVLAAVNIAAKGLSANQPEVARS